MRRLIALAVLIAPAGCGASPTAPPPTPQHYILTAGNYTLNIFGAPMTVGTGSFMVCASMGNVPTSVAVPVTAHREGATWLVRPAAGTLKLMLTEAAGGVSGSLEGSASAGQVTVTIASPGTTASVSALTLGASHLAGAIDGGVRYAVGGLEASCNGNGWSLVPRS